MKTPTLNQIWSQVHPDDTIPQIIEKICGELIGKGTYRDVYEDFIEPWLCPCVRITETSQVLIQKRAKPIESIDQLPKEVPAIFTDLKRSNWGILNKRAVITDYPYLRHVFTQKMRKPKWKDY